MTYYKLAFSLEVTPAYQVFKEIAKKYAANSWSSPGTMFCLISTSDTIEEVTKRLDISNDPIGSTLPGADKLNLTIEKISPDTQGLTQEAKEWLTRQEKIKEEMRAFIDKIDKPT